MVGDIFSDPSRQACVSHGLPEFDIRRLDLAQLADTPHLSGDALHTHLFHHDGISQAVDHLRQSLTQPCFALGYSAGGTALWQAAARGAPIRGLICISSTRLRHETALPIPTLTIFGDQDPNRPDDRWLATVPGTAHLLPQAEHSFYNLPALPPAQQARKHTKTALSKWIRSNPVNPLLITH